MIRTCAAFGKCYLVSKAFEKLYDKK